MQFPGSMIAMTCVFMVVAAPAMGASQKAHEDCDADDPDRNIAGCTRIVEDDAEGDTMRAVAYVARGLAWQAKGDLDHALADYTDAIRLNPRDALAYNNRGLLWREKGDADRAIADLTAIRVDPLPHSDSRQRSCQHLRQPRSRLGDQGRSRPRHCRFRSGHPARSQRRRRLRPAQPSVYCKARRRPCDRRPRRSDPARSEPRSRPLPARRRQVRSLYGIYGWRLDREERS
jgi:Tetratricopeptide repeat